ncbi:MAG: hypothetical protein ACYC7E_00685 [Armatimonadota bacterium]
MRAFVISLCLLCGIVAFAADSVKVVVGHQCCTGCATALIAGAKKSGWVDTVKVNGTTATITAKANQPIEFISLLDAMTKAGFPPSEVLVEAPLMLSIAHLCCGGCANALKQTLVKSTVANLDVQHVTVDLATQTATVQPMTGKPLNLVELLRQMGQGGFSASTVLYKTK